VRSLATGNHFQLGAWCVKSAQFVYFAACDTFCPSARATLRIVLEILRGAKAIASSSEALYHCPSKEEGKKACERSGGYADSLPWQKRHLARSLRSGVHFCLEPKGALPRTENVIAFKFQHIIAQRRDSPWFDSQMRHKL